MVSCLTAAAGVSTSVSVQCEARTGVQPQAEPSGFEVANGGVGSFHLT